MNASPEIKDLAVALVAAQKSMDHARRERTAGAGSARQYRYADLAAVWDACRDALAENGLAIVQTTRTGEACHVLLTRLVHTSGQWIDSETPILAKGNDPQSFGSAMTYARRYALSAIAGVATDDDDGQAAQERPGRTQQAQRQAPTAGPANDAHDPAHVALAAQFKSAIADLPELEAFGDFVRNLEAAQLPKPLLDDVRAELVVAGVRFAVEQEDLDAWVPKLQAWKLSQEARDRAAAAWEKRGDEIAAERGAAA